MDASNSGSLFGHGVSADPNVASTGELAYWRIRSDIVFGRLRPGQRLLLDKLRAAYGVSIGTLREILCSLTADGLVTAEGQRGFQAASCSARDFSEIASLRLLVERHALEQSFHTGDVEWEARVVAAHHKLARIETSLLAGDTASTEQWKRYDWEFHRSVVSACGSHALMKLHSSIYDRYLRYQMVFVMFRGQVAADEHERLLDSALRRDVITAQKTLTAHIQGCVEFASRHALIPEN
jgi:DNA-binding GntR family transcriptional regulator